MANYKTNIVGGSTNFASMMENGFGIVTVMNAKIYNANDFGSFEGMTAYQVKTKASSLPILCELKTLKIANVSQEGPTKTVTGGQFSNPLIKFGKTSRLEMQDALGSAKAIEALGGGFQEWTDSSLSALHFGEDYAGPKTVIGESFFIDQQSGRQVPVTIIFYQFLPDSIFNLTQDAEGDATVFDMNGDLLTTLIQVGTSADDTNTQPHGVFYSIVDKGNGIREFNNENEVNKAAGSLDAGQKIKVNEEEKTIKTITESVVDGVLTYTVAYKE